MVRAATPTRARLLNLSTLACFLVVATTGFSRWFLFPRGLHGGRGTPDASAFLCTAHRWAALAATILIAVHVVQRWSHVRRWLFPK
jgi:hypothetical protein